MIRIALIALLVAAAISQPIGEPIVQEKITHSKPVITEQYGPAEVITEDEAHRLVKQYMTEANQQHQFNKLNWNVASSSDFSGAAAAAPGSNFYIAKPGGYEWLGKNAAAQISALAAPKTYTTATTSYVNAGPAISAAPAASFQWSAPGAKSYMVLGANAPTVKTQSFQISAPAAPALTQSHQYVNAAPALTQSYQYVNAAPAISTINTEAAPQYSTYEYNAAPRLTVDAAPAVNLEAPAAIQTSSLNYHSAAPAFQLNAAPVQYTSAISSNEAPMTEIVQEKDFGLGASSTSAQIEQIKTPASAETFTFGSKSTADRFGTKI